MVYHWYLQDITGKRIIKNLENQYLQDYYEEDEKYLERPEAQQFYKDYLDSER